MQAEYQFRLDSGIIIIIVVGGVKVTAFLKEHDVSVLLL
jgi:hypothetical protein